MPIATTAIVAPTTGCCPPNDRPVTAGDTTFGVTLENEHPWFWTLIGVDQALHHLTGFGLSIFMAAN